ncbi:Hydroxymethylbilane synthase [Purpureocillium takamizusanense]|uniref:hydroxymethylbilane synthase n=1 Tax=Purpureocillium takamizusanense TaxID=2060973 RepID=A0A9Q8QJ73_9HYPO|nr:Hydroxymethylbilane synthase [Purpureocillium takamizusanense]UNI19769.1 Hydroxymethylbilane synthase [Purpureocillium takamizusanense]
MHGHTQRHLRSQLAKMSFNTSSLGPQAEGTQDGSPPHPREIVLGCRKSELALIQARTIASKLSKTHDPSSSSSSSSSSPTTFSVATSSVAGDADKHTPFALLSKQTGGSDVGKSLWTNGLEADMLAGKFHLLVHCLKDMPTTLPPHCFLAAIPKREDPRDAVVMRSGSAFTSIDQLPPGSVVGSSSSRRRALIRRNWPHLEVAECRGNLDTRLAKLDAPSSPFSCILLATAGLLRLGLGHRITQRLDPSVFPYAVGQGALGIEMPAERQEVLLLDLVRHADHKPSRWLGMAERAMLRSLQGGCSSPIGVWSSLEPFEEESGPGSTRQQACEGGGILRLRATVLHVDGASEIYAENSGSVLCDGDAEQLGISVAKLLLDKGARALLAKHE